MASADFTINGGATLAKASVAASSTVTLELDSTDGVRQVLWEIVGTDDGFAPSDYTITNATSISLPATVTAKAVASACIVKCTVNGGTFTDRDGEQQRGELIKQAKFYVPLDDGRELLAFGETTESDLVTGWVGLLNSVLRDASPTVVSTVIAGPYSASISTIVPYSTASGGFTVNLPTAVGKAGQSITFWEVAASTNNLTIDPNGAETINGAATLVVNTANVRFSVTSDGANWISTPVAP